MSEPLWRQHVSRALAEDHAGQDVTTDLLGQGAYRPAIGRLEAERRFVIAGLPIVEAVFAELDAAAVVEPAVEEGGWVEPGTLLVRIRAPVRVLLAGERVTLNFLQRLSGVATATRFAVEAVKGTGTVITDTRKTTPGLRDLEKYAVRVGGGVNHRCSLTEAILWKDNHWALLEAEGKSLESVLRDAPAGLPVQIEVENETQLKGALKAGASFLLVDNQTPETVAKWVAIAGPDVVVEASGGITPTTAPAYARAGAKRISIGSLTHSPKAMPMSFEVTLE